MKLEQGMTIKNYVFNTNKRENVQLYDVLKGKTVLWCLRYIGCTVCRYDVHTIVTRYQDIQDLNSQVFVLMQSDAKHVNDSVQEEPLPFEIICDTQMQIYKDLEINPALKKEDLITPENLEKFKEKAAHCKELGYSHGDYEGDELQLPAMFVVDEKGKCLYSHYGKDIADLPNVGELIEILKTL